MTTPLKSPKDIKTIRERAEIEAARSTPDVSSLSQDEIKTLVHELNVHQIALKIQNDEIMRLWAEAEEANDKYQDLYFNAPLAYITVDPEGVIFDANVMAATKLGIPGMELKGLALSQFMGVEDWNSYFECSKSVLVAGALDGQCEVQFTPAGKPSFIAHLHMAAVKSTENNLLRITIEDITERKHEEQIKDEFLSLVSHELRTPLTIIIGSLSVALHKDISPADIRSMIKNAIETAQGLADILENMLEMTRHQADRLYLLKEPVDMKILVASTIDGLKKYGITHSYQVEMPDDLPKVEADALRVKRILHNLLENAVKYSPADKPVEVSVSAAEGFLLTSVKDHGKGLTKEEQEKLFQLFGKLDNSAAATGTGLGLIVCKRLVEAHGGWIKVESEAGMGAIFTFALPLES